MSKLLLAGVAAIGLLVAGVQKGSADQISACKDNTSGSLFMYATPPAAGCGPGRTLLTLSFGPGSALGASEFFCGSTALTNGGNLSGAVGYNPLVSFGSGITYTPGATTFVLQPGIYQLQLTVYSANINATGAVAFLQVAVLVNGTQLQPTFLEASALVSNPSSPFTIFPVTGNKLLQITAANTTVGFNVGFNTATTTSASHGGCDIIFTQLQ